LLNIFAAQRPTLTDHENEKQFLKAAAGIKSVFSFSAILWWL